MYTRHRCEQRMRKYQVMRFLCTTSASVQSQVACHELSNQLGWKCLDYGLCNTPAPLCGLHRPCASMLQAPEMVSVPLEELVLQNQSLLSRRYFGREGLLSLSVMAIWQS